MLDYDSMIARQRKWMLYFLAILVLGAAFTPYVRIFNGLLLGSVISFYNLWLLQRKTKVLGDAISTEGSARTGLGTFSRLAAVVFAVLIALRYEDTFHIIAVVIGIVSSYIVIMIDVSLRIITEGKHKN